MNNHKFIFKNFSYFIIPLLLGLQVSLFCLVDLTFGWFNTSMNTTSQNIVAANYDIDILIRNTSNGSIVEKYNDRYALNEGNYEILLRRTGTSQNSTGYAEIKIGDNLYNTELLNINVDFIFTLYIDFPVEIQINPIWGSYNLDSNETILNNNILDFRTMPIMEAGIEEDNLTSEVIEPVI